ncbi:MAG: DUF1624 domain-containing protein [Rhodobacteraceae bacterium]|nr:DUF1624 domain-containing protein [Paracoccaceae bacterium]
MNRHRIGALDVARGLAVLAMIAFHMSWDLAWFGYTNWNVNSGQGWQLFAASIAGSFLFLSGVSFAISRKNKFRVHAFWRRFAVLVAAAAGVSLLTYLSFGQSFVRFGILHCLAASALLCLLVARFNTLVLLGLAAFIASAALWAKTPLFDGQLLLWTGLGTPTYGSVDYVPLIPWTALPLFGMALTRIWLFRASADTSASPELSTAKPVILLKWMGRHSLLIYLLHQPLLYGLAWSGVALGIAPDHKDEQFIAGCINSCEIQGQTGAECQTICGCTLDTLQATGAWDKLIRDPADTDNRNALNEAYAQCAWDLQPTQPSAPSQP